MNRLSILLIAVIVTLWSIDSQAQSKRRVKFPSKDGVTITADLYETNPDFPWVVMFHQANSSRGEYIYIGPRMNKLELNCMAVDIRAGKEDNYIVNETYVLARDNKLGTEYLDAEKDMIAAIERAYVASGRRPVIVFGSSYSASLALKLAQEMSEIKAVIAFSPGEYFGKELNVKKTITGLSKPTFIACSASEKKWTDELIAGIPTRKRIYYAPRKGGEHGARSLNKGVDGQTEYWIQMINFVQTVKKEY